MIKMCRQCDNLLHVLRNHYPEEIGQEIPIMVHVAGVYTIILENWPTDISDTPTQEDLDAEVESNRAPTWLGRIFSRGN